VLTKDGVLRAEAAWAAAHQRLDILAVDRMMAAEYLQVGSDGQLRDRADVLASLRSGARHWDAASSDEQVVRLYGECAVVFGRWHGRGVNTGVGFDYRARYVAVWVWRDSRWQMVSDQSTGIAE
jgi:ketosteroid isomerase-like protein